MSTGSRAVIIVLANEKMIGQGMKLDIKYVDTNGQQPGGQQPTGQIQPTWPPNGNPWASSTTAPTNQITGQQQSTTTIDPFGGIWDRIWVRWRSTTTSTTTELPIPGWGK